MKKRILLLFLFVSVICIGQHKEKVYNLNVKLDTIKDNIQKVKVFYELANEYKQLDSVKLFYNKGMSLSKKINYNKGLLDGLIGLSSFYKNSLRFNEATENLDIAKELAVKRKDTLSMSVIYQLYGNIYERKGIYKQAISNLDTSLFYARKVNDSVTLTNILGNLGYNYSMLYKDSIAFSRFFEGLKIAKKIKNPNAISFLSNNIGSLYYFTADYENAENYLKKSIELSKKHKIDNILNSSYGYLGNLYIETGKEDEAIKYLVLALNLAESRNDFFSKQSHLIALADLYYDKEDYFNSKKCYSNALLIDEKVNNKKHLGLIYNGLSNCFLEDKEIDSSLYYNKKALTISKENNYKDVEIAASIILGDYKYSQEEYIQAVGLYESAYNLVQDYNELKELGLFLKIGKCYLKLKKPNKSLTYLNKYSLESLNNVNHSFKLELFSNKVQCYESNGKYSKALDFTKQILSLKDSLYNTQTSENYLNIQTKYQTQQKENEILTLTNDNLIAETNLTQSKYLNFGALGLLLFLSGLGYFYWDKKKQAHKIELLENTVVASEHEKNRIGKELHDGIAGTLIKLVHDSENNQMELSHKLLKTYNEVRELSHQLDNTSMHNELFIDRIEEIFPINNAKQVFNFKVSPINLQLTEPYGTHFYRIIQELIANNIKHAKATETTINIELNNASLLLNYTDNGIGINDIKEGNGISNIRNRVTLMQGNLTIYNLEKGCDFTFNIPYRI